MANPFGKFAQPEVEQNPFGKFAQPQEEPVQKPEEPNSIWTDAADFTKRLLGSSVAGFAAFPKGTQEAAKGAVRKAATGEVNVQEPMPLLAGKLLARKVDELLRGKEQQDKDAVAVERTLAKIPEIPGSTYLRDLGKQVQKTIDDSASEQSKKAVQESQITGNIFKGEVDFGKNPTVRGYAMQLASVLGTFAPTLITTVATKSPTAGGVVGGAMAADEAATTAEEFIGKMSHEDLMKNSPFYASLIKQGVGQAEAKDLATRKAAESGAIMQGLIATFGDRFTAKLATGALDDMLKKAAGKSVLGKTAAGTVIGGVEQGVQETAEGLAADIAIQNVAKNKEIGEDSAANLILGALGGAPVGGVGGLKGALTEKFKDPNTTDQERQTILDTLTQGMQEPAGLFADQEGGEPAGQPGQESQVNLYAQRAADALGSTRGSTLSAKYGDADQTLPPSNEPANLFEDVDTGAAAATTSSAPGVPAAAPAAAPTQSVEAYRDFVRQYTDLRDEYNSLPMGQIDQAGMNQRGLILKDLAAIVDANMGLIRNRGLAAQLKNPMFNGEKALAKLEPSSGQPRAMQGSLIGLYKGAARRMKNAMALAGQSVDGAIAELEDNRARIQEKVDSGGYTDAMIISMRPANMSSGQALKNRDSIVQNYLQTSNAEIDHAIDMLQKDTGQPRAMQGKLFEGAEAPGNKPQPKPQKEQVEEDLYEDEDKEEVRYDQKGNPIRAPKVDTEHVPQTEEGGKIKGFFDSIQSVSNSPAEQERHGNSRNTAANTMLEFDIAQPGETTSAGAQQMLDYLARRVGGQEKLNQLLDALQNADPETQSDLLKKAGLPDLTARRGMDEFSSQVQEYVDQMMGTGEGPLFNIRTSKMRPSKVTGTKIPYQETITTGAMVTSAYATPKGGKPREPSQAIRDVVRDINDNKLRPAALILKQMIGGKVSAQAQAAITYLTNLNRTTFGDALRDLAFDLAYFEVNRKHYGAGSTFYREGGEYAKDFRAWIAANLDPSTLELLDELVAENKQNAEAKKEYRKAKAEYNKQLKARVEEEGDRAEKNGAKLPKAPKRKRERISKKMLTEMETEAGEGEETLSPTREINLENIPSLEMLYDVHPAIVRELEKGNTRKALELLAQTKNSKYYAELAQRLLDTGFTAKTRLIEADVLESLSNNPQITESLNERLDALRDLIVTLYPQEQQAAIIKDLKSGKLRNLIFALDTIEDTLSSNNGTESNQQLLDSVTDLVNKEFAWDGKYDPASDTIVMRQGDSKLTNHLLLHETVHAASSYLIDNADKLVGIQRQGYERLEELFKYSKDMMNQQGVTDNPFYGLQDLHEFVAEALTNPKLQAVLRSYRYKASPFSLWNRFTDSISKMFKVKPGEPSNVMAEVMFAADAMMAGTMSLQGMNEVGGTIPGPPAPRAMATQRPPRTVPQGMPNQPSTIRRLLTANTWTKGKMREIRSFAHERRKEYLGGLTLRQINDLVAKRIPQIDNFIKEADKFLSRTANTLKESGDISRRWVRLQANNFAMSRQIGVVMHSATILEIDPDKATRAQQINNPQLMADWNKLTPEARNIYRAVRDFYERQYNQYKRLMRQRINNMRGLGPSNYQISKMLAHIEGVPENVLARIENYSPSEDTLNTLLRSGFTKKVQSDLASGGADAKTIIEIRAEFEKGKRKGVYFPLMRFGQFWYQIGKGAKREYYMFESQAAREAHLQERLEQAPNQAARIALEDSIGPNIGSEYKQQMDLHASQSNFLKEAFAAIDSMNITGLSLIDAADRKAEMKDNLYQTYLVNQPERSMRNAFIHRNSVAGYSEDALRVFSSSSYSMAYQMARLEYSPEMFSQLSAARAQIKGRFTPGARYDPVVTAENDELTGYVTELDKRLKAILDPVDVGAWVAGLSNLGFIYYLSSLGTAAINVLGGAVIGIPTMVGQLVRMYPNMGYTEATGRVLYSASKTAAQIFATGFDIEGGGSFMESRLLSPSLDRSKSLSAIDRAAYNRFVADQLIDITATYDQSGLASNATTDYSGFSNKAMQVIAYSFHHAERFNREVMAMTSFRAAYEKRVADMEASKRYKDLVNNLNTAVQSGNSKAEVLLRRELSGMRRNTFTESIADAKDLTHRAMFDYSGVNKPRWLQSAPARIIFQFKQFPHQMTWFLARNAWNSSGKLPEADKREARARFVGIMGTTAIMTGVTGLWGFSTVAAIVEACAAFGDDDDEPFDFELEFANWAVNTFGKNMGTMVSRGVGNAAGIDLNSRLKLDDMWFRDGRNNLDAEASLKQMYIAALGPLPNLGVNFARAYDLYNKGHGDRAAEALLPGFAKQPFIADRYATKGARTLQGDIMKKDFTPFELMMQSLGIRSSELAEIQFRNIKVKGQSEAILKNRENLLNIFGLTIMTNDEKGTQKAIADLIKFSAKYPTIAVDVDTLLSSVRGKLEKQAESDHGLYVNPKLRYLFKDTYIRKITEEENKPAPVEESTPAGENPFGRDAQ